MSRQAQHRAVFLQITCLCFSTLRGSYVSLRQAQHRAPTLQTYLRGLDGETRAALLRELKGTLGELYPQVLLVFGV